MPPSRWDQRFFATTRGQVVLLLRRGFGTVDELARELGLTDNAVRAHLSALERDGLVAQTGVRRGVGKPAYAYALTPDAERFFPKRYGTILGVLIDVLSARLPAEAVAELVRDAGRRIVGVPTAPTAPLRVRVEHGVALLDEMGGQADIEERDGGFVIRGRSCPLAEAVRESPDACCLAEAMLADAIGAPVRQACDPAIPRCCFEVGPAIAPSGDRSPSVPAS